MSRIMMIVISIVVAFCLTGCGVANANKGTPTWETAFDPGPSFGYYHMIHAIEEYKGDLYAVAGDPGWFDYNWDSPRSIAPGQVFRSPDGKNWTPASDTGFGLGAVKDESGSNYYDTSWDMTVYNNMLYVLPYDQRQTRAGVILRSSDGQTWESVATTEEFGLSWTEEGSTYFNQFFKLGVYKGMLYVATNSIDPVKQMTSAMVFRSSTGDPGTWEKVVEFQGWGSVASFHVFKDTLYVASDSVHTQGWQDAPEQIWRTNDGMNWEKVVADGFGNPASDGLGGFAEYKGYLYVGSGTNVDDGGQIWRSNDGTQWEPVPLDGFGSPLDGKVDGLVVYLGDLYAYTTNWSTGGSVFRTSDAKTWERVSEPGWGNPTYVTSHLESAQAVFKGNLYLGVVAPQGLLLKLVYQKE